MRNRLMVAAALLMLFAAVPARAEVKLAFVDVQRALNECEAGKTAKAEFRVKVEAAERKLQETYQPLKCRAETRRDHTYAWSRAHARESLPRQ